MKEKFTVGFIGLGLIGGSIAKALKYYYPDVSILACTRSRETMDHALSEQIIDKAYDSLDASWSECDYIFLCAPVESNASYLKELKPLLGKNCILTDVGSTKTDIHEHVTALGLEHCFIGGHPMAGSEKTGIRNSKRHLIENAYYILTPSALVAPEKVEDFTTLVSSLKALPLVLDCHEHDYVTGAVSHLPHIIASTLVNLVHAKDTPSETMRTIAAGGFKDITRIASSSPEMWEQICTTNADNLISILDDYMECLRQVRGELQKRDNRALNRLFADSRDYRNSFSDLSSGPLKKIHRLYCDLVDETGGIAIISTILASSNINLKNIGIVHNREFEDAVLRVEFYEEESLHRAAELLRKYRYTVYAD